MRDGSYEPKSSIYKRDNPEIFLKLGKGNLISFSYHGDRNDNSFYSLIDDIIKRNESFQTEKSLNSVIENLDEHISNSSEHFDKANGNGIPDYYLMNVSKEDGFTCLVSINSKDTSKALISYWDNNKKVLNEGTFKYLPKSSLLSLDSGKGFNNVFGKGDLEHEMYKQLLDMIENKD